MPTIIIDDSKFTVSEEVVKRFEKYIIEEDDILYIHNISPSVFKIILDTFRDNYENVISSIYGQQGGNNIVKLQIPDSDDDNSEICYNSDSNSTDELFDALNNSSDSVDEVYKELDTSVIYSGNPDAINNLVDDIEKSLNTESSMSIINQLSTDPYIINYIKDFNNKNNELESYSDSLNVPESFFSSDEVTDEVDDINPNITTRYIHIN